MDKPVKPPGPNAGMPALFGWVAGYAVRRWLLLAGTLALMLVKILLDLLRPWPLLVLVDYVLSSKEMPGWLQTIIAVLPGSHSTSAMVGWCVGSTVVIFLLGWIAGVLYAYSSGGLGQRIVYDLAADLFSRLQELSLRFHSASSVGDNLRRVTSDCTCISVILKDALIPMLSALMTLVLMTVILWRVDPVLTCAAIAVVPWMMLVFRQYARPMLDRSYEQQQSESVIYQIAEQTFASIPAVKAFCREQINESRFARATAATIDSTVKLTVVQLRFKIWMGLATATGTALILWMGVREANSGMQSVGTIILFLSYLASFYEPLAAVMYTSTIIQGAAGSARRVLEIYETQADVEDRPGAQSVGKLKGDISFENVVCGYDSGKPVLQGITLDIKAGECIALVGASGAGKTTLAGLVPRFLDVWEGCVKVDGVDVRQMKVRELRRQVSVVLQDSFLFPVSIAANIAYGVPGVGRERVETAARLARAHDFIQKLPKGYRTIVSERGASLSIGQRQRIAIARALLKEAPILILDEPSSALDATTEKEILDSWDDLIRNRTTLIISHRLSTVQKANRIAVLKQGRIVELGTHQQLLARKGEYAHLYELHAATRRGRG